MELCAGRLEGKWEEGAEGPLALMFRDGDSGFGVEDDDEAERRRTEKSFYLERTQNREMAVHRRIQKKVLTVRKLTV